MPNILPPSDLDPDYLASLHINKTYDLYEPKKIQPKRFEQIQVSTDKKVFRLQDRFQFDIVSLIVVEKVKYSENQFFEVKWAHSSFPRKQYLSYLFEFLIYELNLNILSDKEHTSPGSKEYWLSLGRKNKFDLYVYNIKTNYKRKYKNYPEDKIWGLSNSYYDEIVKLLAEFPSLEGIITDNLVDDIYSQVEIASEIEQSGIYEFESNDQFEDYDEIESLEEIDFKELDKSKASIEIYKYVRKYKDSIENLENIRLIAQKST